VKDVIETKGLATEYGSPVYKGRIGTRDAAIVHDLRLRGGVLLGKTHTAAFAYRRPPPTRNPRNPDHTPGGSSRSLDENAVELAVRAHVRHAHTPYDRLSAQGAERFDARREVAPLVDEFLNRWARR
jgi:hypothetical protein